jgi:hypothetical protein
MTALIIKIFLVLAAMAVAGVVAARAVLRGAARALGIGENDPARRALRAAERIRGHLASSRAGEMYGPVLGQLDGLVNKRLPRLAETRDRLEAHLRDKPLAELEVQLSTARSELHAATDAEVKALCEKNVQLATDRLALHRQLATVHARTIAQLKNALMTLEALEDRVASVKLLPAAPNVAKELESMLDEVTTLETEYKNLDLLPQ